MVEPKWTNDFKFSNTEFKLIDLGNILKFSCFNNNWYVISFSAGWGLIIKPVSKLSYQTFFLNVDKGIFDYTIHLYKLDWTKVLMTNYKSVLLVTMLSIASVLYLF